MCPSSACFSLEFMDSLGVRNVHMEMSKIEKSGIGMSKMETSPLWLGSDFVSWL